MAGVSLGYKKNFVPARKRRVRTSVENINAKIYRLPMRLLCDVGIFFLCTHFGANFENGKDKKPQLLFSARSC